MNLKDFQLLDNEPIDNSIIKRDYLKVYHQQGANTNDSNQNFEFSFGEKNNYHQNGNAYFEIDIIVRNTAGNFIDAGNIRLINNAFANCFKEVFSSITGGSDLEHNKYVAQVSTIMRLLTTKNSILSSCFDKNGEKDFNDNNVLKQILINNHPGAIKCKIKGQLALEHIFGFCKTFKKITKNLGFHLTFKKNDLQDDISYYNSHRYQCNIS